MPCKNEVRRWGYFFFLFILHIVFFFCLSKNKCKRSKSKVTVHVVRKSTRWWLQEETVMRGSVSHTISQWNPVFPTVTTSDNLHCHSIFHDIYWNIDEMKDLSFLLFCPQSTTKGQRQHAEVMINCITAQIEHRDPNRDRVILNVKVFSHVNLVCEHFTCCYKAEMTMHIHSYFSGRWKASQEQPSLNHSAQAPFVSLHEDNALNP